MKTLLIAPVIRRRLCAAAILTVSIFVPAAAQDGPTTGRVAQVKPAGKLKVRQRKSQESAEATIGMIVRRSYRLDLESGGQARLSVQTARFTNCSPVRRGAHV